MFRKMLLQALLMIAAGLGGGLFSGSVLADAASDAVAAEKAGQMREALELYVTALQESAEGTRGEQDLREAVIRVARGLNPPPAIPPDAERHLARGEAAVEIAADKSGYADAIREFKQALKVAPWLAAGYYNLSVVQEKAGDYAGAIQSTRLYLLAAPGAEDAKANALRIMKLEYKLENTIRPEDVAGRWQMVPPNPCCRYEVSARNDVLVVQAVWVKRDSPDDPPPGSKRTMYELTMDETGRLDGPPQFGSTSRIRGKVSEHGRRLEIDYFGELEGHTSFVFVREN